MKIKFNANLMKLISIFDSITHVSAKDCIDDNIIIFIVNQGDIGKAIGRGGINIKRLERLFKKKIKIIEFNSDPVLFVKNVVSPLKVSEIKLEGSTIVITSPDSKTRGLLIGRGAVNLRGFENIVKRYFPIDEIKIV